MAAVNEGRMAQTGTSDTAADVIKVLADFLVWLDKQEDAQVYRWGRFVASDLNAIIVNGPLLDLVQGLDLHVRQLDVAVKAIQ